MNEAPATSVEQAPPIQRGSFYDCTRNILARREQLVLSGYQFIGNGHIRPNENCGCSSGRKFKNCCESNVVRLAGATWFKPGATARTRRML